MSKKSFFKPFFFFLLVLYFAGPPINTFAETTAPPVLEEEAVSFYSDRFIFRGKDIDDLIMVVFVFERGREESRYFGQFFGAVFEKNHWSLLEGNDRYPYRPEALALIQPSYYANAKGTRTSGFVLGYDGGDFTIKMSSGAVEAFYTPSDGETIKNDIGISEAVVTLHGKDYWGDLIHESLIWNKFNSLTRHRHLYKSYQGFYLKSDSGMQIHFHQNKADREAFFKETQLTETLQSEGGAILLNKKIIYTFDPPIMISELDKKTPPFSVYKVPSRWHVETTSDIGELLLWTRGETAMNWLVGGYHLMAIEGLAKNGEKEERVWGFAEYFP